MQTFQTCRLFVIPREHPARIGLHPPSAPSLPVHLSSVFAMRLSFHSACQFPIQSFFSVKGRWKHTRYSTESGGGSTFSCGNDVVAKRREIGSRREKGKRKEKRKSCGGGAGGSKFSSLVFAAIVVEHAVHCAIQAKHDIPTAILIDKM